MKIVGVIPARWGSTRFPGKSLALIKGRPLIQWVVESCQKARSLHELLVATDDERIYDVALKMGVTAVMTRADHPSGTDRVAEAIRGRAADVVANIQGDEPLMDPLLIDRLATEMRADPGWDMVTAAAPLAAEDDAPSVCKVVFDGMGRALYFSRSTIPYVRDAGFRTDAVLRWGHIGIYFYRVPFLARLVNEPPSMLERAECLEQLRALHIGARIKVVQCDYAGVGVDVPADVAKVEALLCKIKI